MTPIFYKNAATAGLPQTGLFPALPPYIFWRRENGTPRAAFLPPKDVFNSPARNAQKPSAQSPSTPRHQPDTQPRPIRPQSHHIHEQGLQ